MALHHSVIQDSVTTGYRELKLSEGVQCVVTTGICWRRTGFPSRMTVPHVTHRTDCRIVPRKKFIEGLFIGMVKLTSPRSYAKSQYSENKPRTISDLEETITYTTANLPRGLKNPFIKTKQRIFSKHKTLFFRIY